MKRILTWATHEYSLRTRLLALIPAGFLFLFLFPYTLVVLFPRLDVALNLPRITFGVGNIIIGGLLVIIGAIFGLWSIIQQMTQAQGTPIPVMATQKLLIHGVFKYSRNPMLFGTLCAYLGVAVLVGSISAMVAVILFTLLIIAYIKTIEEKELEMRFGQGYLDYKASTPFFFQGCAGESKLRQDF